MWGFLFLLVVVCSAVTITVLLTTDNSSDSTQLQSEYEDDADVLHLGDFEICSWERVPVAESVMVNGQPMNFSTPIIQGETCDTGELVILVIGSNGVHGSIGSTRVTAESESVSSFEEEDMDVGLSLDEESPETEAWAAKFKHDQEKYASLANGRRQLLTPGLVDIHLHLDLDKHMTDTLGDYGAAEYAVELVAVVNRDVYYQLGFNLKVVSINLRDTFVAQSTSTIDYLNVIQAEGLPENTNLVHSLTTRNLGGGVAYLGGLYSSSRFGYGVSGSLRGEFNKWDLVVVAHELGHNFGADHTHEMTPQVDTCGVQCPADPSGATIMSYCHQCRGGLNNIDYIFHEEVKKVILGTYDSRNQFLADRAECSDLSKDVPDVGVPFYLKTDECLDMPGENPTLCNDEDDCICTLQSAWVRTTDSGAFNLVSSNDRDLCWQANCESSSLELASCGNAVSQTFEFQGAELRSVLCGAAVTESDNLLSLKASGKPLQQWCAPDAPTATPAPTATVPCENSNNGATDPFGDDCAWYDANPNGCGDFDDADFRSNEMCCTCGGGFDPTQVATEEPTGATAEPTNVVTEEPTLATLEPTDVVTQQPTAATPEPTNVVTQQPTSATPEPTNVVTQQPTSATPEPTQVITSAPVTTTQVVTAAPVTTPSPTQVNTAAPVTTPQPTQVVTAAPVTTPPPTQVNTAAPVTTPQPTQSTTPTSEPGQCENTNNGAADPWGDDCSWYDSHPWGCGNYNDDDFRSEEMCCVCGGGSGSGVTTTAPTSPPPTDGGVEEARCYINECGCAPFLQPWCDALAHQLTDWCAESESNCQACNGAWCTSGSGATPSPTSAAITDSPSTMSPTSTASPTTASPSTESPTTMSPTTSDPTSTTEASTAEIEYEVVVIPDGQTCKNSGRISRPCRGPNSCSQSFCQQQCDDTTDCMFYFFNTRGRCHLYRECDEFRQPHRSGVTMQKILVEPSSTSASTTVETTSVETTMPEATSSPWEQGVKLTHFWDCNGMACDAPTLQPWDLSKYVASPGYSPQNPDNHGGAVYGEKMWLVGAASDSMSELLGAHDPCCGSPSDGSGCGKCVLMRVNDAVNKQWTALVMKKNRCPPWSNGCEAGKLHFDMAVPGYDNLQYSTANVCGARENTGFASQQASAVLGDWYNTFDNTAAAGASLCTTLPPQFQEGCELFSSWGWIRGDPDAEYRVVDCPEAFKAHVAAQFGPDGVRV